MEIYILSIAITGIWFVGLIGFLVNKGDLIRSFLCLELSAVMVGLHLVLTDMTLGTANGRLMSVIILGLSASETSIALSATVLFYRRHVVTVVGNFLRG